MRSLLTYKAKALSLISPLVSDERYIKWFYYLVFGKRINLDNPATRIYTDCFTSYQELDFNNLGYILLRVNHSVLWTRNN